MDYETEEQQVEAIKKWWKENSTMVITGITVGVASIFGWQYYQDQSIKHTEQASVIYETVMAETDQNGALNDQQARVNQLMAEFDDTPYASLSALVLAKQYLSAGEALKSQQQLEWVINNTSQDELKYLAKVRLARVYMSSQQGDHALSILNETFPQSFKAIVLELKGDLLVTMGKLDQARQAYNEALGLSAGNSWLQLKIDDLGVTRSAPEEADPSA